MIMRLSGIRWTALTGLIGLLLIWASNIYGWWYVTFVIGLLVGLFVRKKSEASTATVIACIGGWGLPLLWWSISTPVRHTASLVAQMMGFGPYAFLVIVLTLVLGLLLCLAGLWLARTVTFTLASFMVRQARFNAGHPLGDSHSE